MLSLYVNIKNERLKNGWTQTELAKRVGYSDKSMIAKIESGKVDLPQTKIRAFAKVFNCTESYLMGWDDIPDNKASIIIENNIANNPGGFVEHINDEMNKFKTPSIHEYESVSKFDLTDEEMNLIIEYRNADEQTKKMISEMFAYFKRMNQSKNDN